LDNKFNIFEGMFTNYFFLGINAVMIGGQVLIIFVGGSAFSITRLNGWQWAVCIGLAALSLPWAVVIRIVPDAFVQSIWNKISPVYHFFGRSWASFKRAIPKTKWQKKRAERKAAKEEEVAEKSEYPTSDVENNIPMSSAGAPEIRVHEGNTA